MKLQECNHTTVIERGCPQGSVLSPFLWNLIADEILATPSRDGTKIQAFADDLMIMKTAMNKSTIQIHLQNKIEEIVKWGSRNQLLFSANKSETITFTRKHKNIDINLSLENVPIPQKNQVKYLGVIIDHKLT